MSFRARLTSFFFLIVVIPMIAVAILVFRLIDSTQSSKADARASGVAAAAANVYRQASVQASLTARTLASELAITPAAQLGSRAASLSTQDSLARITIAIGARTVVDLGNRAAIAPGIAVVAGSAGRPRRTFEVSQLTASQYARELSGTAVGIVVRSASQTLASTVPNTAKLVLQPGRGTVTSGSTSYRTATQTFPGFANSTVTVSVLSDLAGGSVSEDRELAAIFIAAFMLLALFFAMLSSRALQGQLSRFLEAARRLAAGDFSSPIPTSGRDEFAQLGQEFNNMSQELERRLGELEQERARVRKSIRRIGEAFASGLDREALLRLALRTAMDATDSQRGRVSARESAGDPLEETMHVGDLDGLEQAVYETERRALESDGTGEAQDGSVMLASVCLGPITPGGPTHGLITVCREGRRFTEDDTELLRSLAAQATLALANVSMHQSIQHQAITDDLTGLATHGRFQELLGAEMEEVRRYHYPVGLIMLDIDNFKTMNDLYGHQQGDRVLRAVADTLRATSRDVDVVARYGGEEMAVILPHTDLEGAYEMAERCRMAVQGLQIPRFEGGEPLSVTVSVGAATSIDGDKDALIAAADGALYVAKREGKNRTVKAVQSTADVAIGE